jgi:hypothetical protein
MSENKKQQRKKKRQAPDTSDIGRDTSNQFADPITMALQNEQADLANMWRGVGGEPTTAAPVQTQTQAQTPVAADDLDDAQTRYLEGLMDLWRTKQANQSPEAIRQNLQSLAEYEDPVGHAKELYEARQATDPWGPGGQFEGRRAQDLYSPEAILASQGRTAENMIRQAGGGRKPVEGEPAFDVNELKRMNRIYAANKSYV